MLNATIALVVLAVVLAIRKFRRSEDTPPSYLAVEIGTLAVFSVLIVLPYEKYLAHRLLPLAIAHPVLSTPLQVLSTDGGGLLVAIPAAAIIAFGLSRSRQIRLILRRVRRLGIVLTAAALVSVPLVAFAIMSAPTAYQLASRSARGAPNIILVTLDALSANAMSLYGAKLPTTPSLERFARRGVVVDRMISASNFTTPGLSTILSGLDVDEHGNNELGSYFIPHPGSNPRDFLPARLSEAGYDVADIVANFGGYPPRLRIGQSFSYSELSSSTCNPIGGVRARIDGLNLSFATVMYPHLASAFGIFDFAACSWRDTTDVPAEATYSQALNWLDHVHDKRRPLFLWVHTFEPHAPYVPPPPYRKYFNKSGRWVGSFPFAIGEIPSYQPARADAPDMRLLAARYAENVRYADAALGGFVTQVERRGLLSNTILIVTSDHGETFDRWVQHDGPFLNQDLIGIPFVVAGPGVPVGKRLHGFAAQKDIAPTILDFAGVRIPATMTGHSLRGWIQGTADAPDFPIFSMRIQKSQWQGPIGGGTFALIEGSIKYVQYFDAGREELYDLSRDPNEAHDLSRKRPILLAHMRKLLDTHLARRKPPYQSHAL